MINVVKLLSAACEKGHREAQINLAIIKENGHGVPRNLTQAAILYRQAAIKGYKVAQCNLGVMYANGKGVPQVGLVSCCAS